MRRFPLESRFRMFCEFFEGDNNDTLDYFQNQSRNFINQIIKKYHNIICLYDSFNRQDYGLKNSENSDNSNLQHLDESIDYEERAIFHSNKLLISNLRKKFGSLNLYESAVLDDIELIDCEWKDFQDKEIRRRIRDKHYGRETLTLARKDEIETLDQKVEGEILKPSINVQ